MKRIASHVSTSVENTAASASAPIQGGSSSVSTLGSTRSGALVCGSATRPTYGELAYSAAKAGVVALTKGAAQEYGPTIRVNSVSPGVIRTPMSEPMFALDGALDPVWEAMPLGRAGTVDEVADVILFLASEQSRYVTGQDLIVDGGLGLAQAGITTTLHTLVEMLRG